MRRRVGDLISSPNRFNETSSPNRFNEPIHISSPNHYEIFEENSYEKEGVGNEEGGLVGENVILPGEEGGFAGDEGGLPEEEGGFAGEEGGFEGDEGGFAGDEGGFADVNRGAGEEEDRRFSVKRRLIINKRQVINPFKQGKKRQIRSVREARRAATIVEDFPFHPLRLHQSLYVEEEPEMSIHTSSPSSPNRFNETSSPNRFSDFQIRKKDVEDRIREEEGEEEGEDIIRDVASDSAGGLGSFQQMDSDERTRAWARHLKERCASSPSTSSHPSGNLSLGKIL